MAENDSEWSFSRRRWEIGDPAALPGREWVIRKKDEVINAGGRGEKRRWRGGRRSEEENKGGSVR